MGGARPSVLMGSVGDLYHHFLEAVDQAAISSAAWRGLGEKEKADEAAVEAMSLEGCSMMCVRHPFRVFCVDDCNLADSGFMMGGRTCEHVMQPLDKGEARLKSESINDWNQLVCV